LHTTLSPTPLSVWLFGRATNEKEFGVSLYKPFTRISNYINATINTALCEEKMLSFLMF
jgi:hypothetical protein